MPIKLQPASASQGQFFIDIIIATGLFVILMHAIFSLAVVIYDTIGYTRTRISAKYVATEKMELLSNMPYEDLGTTTGIPNGIIPEYETLERNGLSYQIHTTVIYVDDPYDEQVPNDLLATDYKRLRVEVSWQGRYNANSDPVVMVTDIAPRGVETSEGGGTLSIFVINSMAQPVFGATVTIANSTVFPNINMTLKTNIDGRVILPGAPACGSCYHLTTTKTDYSTDRTYTTAEVAYPDKKPITVEEGKLSETVFVIDKLAQITFKSFNDREHAFSNYPNITIRLTGNKTIGTDTNGDPVFKFDQLVTTGANSEYTLSNIEWDSYMITLPDEDTLNISGIYPHLPFLIDPDEDITLKIALTAASTHNLLLNIQDATGSAVASASAYLNLSPSFEASSTSGISQDPDFGQAFFKSLNANTYSFTITHPDYLTKVGDAIVNHSSQDTIQLDK